MKNFAAFRKHRKSREDHFTWSDGDTVRVESLEEWTADKPLKQKTDEDGHAYLHTKTFKDDPHRNEFHDHEQSLSQVHKEHRNYYKGDSYSTNRLLRKGKLNPDEAHMNVNHIHDHIKHMDHVTSYRTKHHHMTFRGGVEGDVHRFKPGHKFQDHGYTGTSFHHHIADSFSYSKVYHKKNDPKNKNKDGHLSYDDMAGSGKKRVIHVIHSPPGTKAHHIDHGGSNGMDHEKEFVLHRGTKFKVTHHSEDEHRHYIHSRVVGQHPKKIPEGYPGKSHSSTGYKKHEEDSGITITKHEEPFHKEGAKITINLSPAQKSFLKKKKLDDAIAKSKEKT